MKLSCEDFLHVVSNTPLVSIDLIIKNRENHILIGKRVNEPAKDYWFVPGGRIFKNETIKNAIIRLMKEELAIDHFDTNYKFLGVYEHMYETCFYQPNPYITTTHYVVIGLQINLENTSIDYSKILDQHSSYKWLDISLLLNDPMVHVNTKRYFHENQ